MVEHKKQEEVTLFLFFLILFDFSISEDNHKIHNMFIVSSSGSSIDD